MSHTHGPHMSSRYLASLFALLLLGACSDKAAEPAGSADDTGAADAVAGDVDQGPPDFEARPGSGAWLAGDFHVHATGASNDAHEASTPERIKEVALERGLDFLVLTDHSNSTGSDPSTLDEDPALFNQGPEFPYWDKAAELSNEDFLMVDGNEISPVDEGETAPRGHVGCYPRSLEDFDPDIAFVDRPRGEVSGGETLQQGLDAGCFTTINHPLALVSWISYDWTAYGYDAIEVWNGGAGWDPSDVQARDAWSCDLSVGRSVLAIGGSDNHKINIEPPGSMLDPPLGFPVTYVYADGLEWSGIVEALDAHRVSLSDTGAPLDVDVYDADGGWQAMIGDTIAVDQARWLRARGHLDGRVDEPRVLTVYRIRPDACNDTRQEGVASTPEPNLEVLAEEEVDPDTDFEVIIDLDLEAGDAVFAVLEPERVGMLTEGVAMSNAIYIGSGM